MGGVEVPQAPRMVGGVSTSPLGKGSGGRAPYPEIFFVFFVENTIFWRILTRLYLK